MTAVLLRCGLTTRDGSLGFWDVKHCYGVSNAPGLPRSAAEFRVYACSMMANMQRRTFLASLLSAAATSRLRGQSDTSWGGPVLDTHLHLRANADSCYTHMQ